jgi:general secretion pathway protein J
MCGDTSFFAGNENSIRFVTSIPGHLGIGGFYEVAIYLAEGEPGNRVELSWRLFRAAEASSGPAIEEQHVVLISRVNQIQFAYFGYRVKNELARWYNDWQNMEKLPDLIRVRVTFSGSNHIWPDLIAAPMVQSLNLNIESLRELL